MTLYTHLPLELVLEGFDKEPAPMIELERGELRLLVAPTAPGVGRLVRLLSAPLNAYLLPEFAPGSLIYYGPSGPAEGPSAPLFQPSSIM